MLDQKGFDLWADEDDKAVGLSEEDKRDTKKSERIEIRNKRRSRQSNRCHAGWLCYKAISGGAHSGGCDELFYRIR